jgi:signal transduction histidine kinase
MKENLQHLVDKEMKKSSNQLEMLKEQSRLASMGELIEIIIHQWISPLNGIKVRTEFIKNECKKDRLDKKTIENYTQEQIDNINHLITTLKEFRDFLKPKGELQCVKLLKLITYVRMLLKDVLVKNNVILNIDIDENFYIHVHQNEFTHVFINLINNSIDAFVENKKRVRNIDIYTKKDLTGFSIVFKDNAGGVSDYTLERLFDKHYTTKKEGTGIGLYLVKNIVEKIGGEISAKNISDGLEFIIHIAD